MSNLKKYTVPSLTVFSMETEGMLADSNFVTSTIIFIGLYNEDDEELDPENAL